MDYSGVFFNAVWLLLFVGVVICPSWFLHDLFSLTGFTKIQTRFLTAHTVKELKYDNLA